MGNLDRPGQRMELPDGRVLGYDEHGPPDGAPLFYFHGVPSSRLDWRLMGDGRLAQRHGLRVIAVDRPGVGLSGFKQGRRIVDWPDDVAALADRLGIQRFAVLGYSAGGPYAAASALRLGDRVTRAGIVSSATPNELARAAGASPFTAWFLSLARNQPGLSRLLLGFMGLASRLAPPIAGAAASVGVSAPDRPLLRRAPTQRKFINMLREAVRQGPKGSQTDAALISGDWGFRPEGIRVPVRVWHGEQDINSPPAIARYFASAIPGCQTVTYPDEGHLSVVVNRAEEILSAFGRRP